MYAWLRNKLIYGRVIELKFYLDREFKYFGTDKLKRKKNVK